MKNPIFTAGRRYRVKRSFASGESTFVAGDVIIFEGDGYSWYDNCFVYQFHSEGDGQEKVWFLHEDEPAGLCEDLFEPL